MVKYYCGIGSRESPDPILTQMEELAYLLARAGWTLRSGCAPGADSAFESGARIARGEVELFIPWPEFEGRQDEQLGPSGLHSPAEWTYPIAEEFHPRWEALKAGGKRLHARNVHQILGPTEESPISKFVVCWTSDGKASGGTGQALRIAEHYGVEIFNMQRSSDKKRLERWIEMAKAA